MNPRHNTAPNTVDLRAYDSDFGRAHSKPAAERINRDEVPDGFYQTRVEDVTLSRTHNTGNPMLVWRLRILGPTSQGRSITKIRVITQKTLPYVKQDLQRLGLELSRLSEVQSRMNEMIDREVSVYKKTDTDRNWVDVSFVRKRKDPASEPAESETAWESGIDDDLPF
ncbi:DUF669 domain-containing protein [uncultured Paludibaculum sp.]|uniref:DUF669 domain-containing protein n=1 Tax=uncultured Paludibaculum sp. TaxID=1765020 RepID=UPI002AAB4D07|nr:DUF669 domain-containing protein [uncultured Paludibaculum sp.]